MREGIKLLAGLLVAALLLWVVLRGIEPSTMWNSVRKASMGGLFLAALINLGHNVFRVWRWQALLTPVRPRVPFRSMFVAVILGYTTTWIIPGRLGEVVRPTLLSAREDLPLGPCIGSVVTDRLLDGAAIVALFAVGTWLVPLEGQISEHVSAIRTTSLILVVFVGVLLFLLIAASAARGSLEGWVEARKGPVRWCGRLILSLSEGARALRSPRLVLRITVHSLLAWLVIALGTWLGVRAAGAQVSLAAVFVILPMLALGVAVPTPGGAGSYHGAMKLGLMLFGVSEIVSVSAALLMHLMIIVPTILLGLVLIRTEKLSWRDIISAARKIRGLGASSELVGRPAEEAP